jgi:hypothetical protein
LSVGAADSSVIRQESEEFFEETFFVFFVSVFGKFGMVNSFTCFTSNKDIRKRQREYAHTTWWNRHHDETSHHHQPLLTFLCHVSLSEYLLLFVMLASPASFSSS